MVRSPSFRVRLGAPLLALLAAAVLVPAPLLAAPLPNYGSTVNCRYSVTQSGKYGWTEALLKRIAVQSPAVYAKSGTQLVGWQFVVRRSLDRTNTPWVVTYRSHIQKRLATTSTPAAFDAMRVDVNVPTDVEWQAFVWYKVTLRVFWYDSDGSVASKDSSLFADYSMHVNGENQGTDEFCAGLALQFFD